MQKTSNSIDMDALSAALGGATDPTAAINYTGKEEKDFPAEMQAMMTEFKKSSKRERELYLDCNDSEYWCCFVFQTRAQKEEFLSKLELTNLGDKYIDGFEAARMLGKPLTPVNRQSKFKTQDKKMKSIPKIKEVMNHG